MGKTRAADKKAAFVFFHARKKPQHPLRPPPRRREAGKVFPIKKNIFIGKMQPLYRKNLQFYREARPALREAAPHGSQAVGKAPQKLLEKPFNVLHESFQGFAPNFRRIFKNLWKPSAQKKRGLLHPSGSLSQTVGIPGLEPGKTGPESVVLPLHHIPFCF